MKSHDLGWNASDWDDYWAKERLPHELVAAQRKWVRRIIKFGVIKNLRFRSVADAGCGPAIALFELARKLPSTSFHGYDMSPAIVTRNNNKAEKLGLHNLSFDTLHLPDVPEQHLFDLILCIATLHYVQENIKAIKNLYRILRPGGVLIFNYPNRYTMFWYQKNADRAMKKRFVLLLSGKNILTRAEIEKGVGRLCHNFWREAGETIHRSNPCVFVQQPGPGLRRDQ